MSSGIEWTEETWSPVVGCTKVSPGCAYCYAERQALRFEPKQPKWDARSQRKAGTAAVSLRYNRLEKPFSMKEPKRIFVNPLSDLFHEEVPDEYILRVFEVMEKCPQHTFQLLTKRPERALELANKYPLRWWWPRNVHYGVSAENQDMADLRVPRMLASGAVVKWISIEPLLGPLSVSRWLGPWDEQDPVTGQVYSHDPESTIDWVVVGGESGGPAGRRLVEKVGKEWVPIARKKNWVRFLRDECAENGVAFFFKQWGGLRHDSGGKLLDGRLEEAYPNF